jgi:hypothetical protein
MRTLKDALPPAALMDFSSRKENASKLLAALVKN